MGTTGEEKFPPRMAVELLVGLRRKTYWQAEKQLGHSGTLRAKTTLSCLQLMARDIGVSVSELLVHRILRCFNGLHRLRTMQMASAVTENALLLMNCAVFLLIAKEKTMNASLTNARVLILAP